MACGMWCFTRAVDHALKEVWGHNHYRHDRDAVFRWRASPVLVLGSGWALSVRVCVRCAACYPVCVFLCLIAAAVTATSHQPPSTCTLTTAAVTTTTTDTNLLHDTFRKHVRNPSFEPTQTLPIPPLLRRLRGVCSSHITRPLSPAIAITHPPDTHGHMLDICAPHMNLRYIMCRKTGQGCA